MAALEPPHSSQRTAWMGHPPAVWARR